MLFVLYACGSAGVWDLENRCCRQVMDLSRYGVGDTCLALPAREEMVVSTLSGDLIVLSVRNGESPARLTLRSACVVVMVR